VDVPNDVPGPGDAEVVYLFDPADDPGPVAATPTGLFGLLAGALDAASLDDVVITATVSGLQRRARWATFELIDQAPDAPSPDARLRVIAFARVLGDLDRDFAAAGIRLTEGMTVAVTGGLEWRPAWGELRLVASGVTAVAQGSALLAGREELVAELRATGLVGRQQSLVVPARPLRVGLLAGAGAAGSADVRALLEASGVEWQLTTRSAPMAGPEAAAAVAAGIDGLAVGRLDVIVVARGGGARSELSCFDTRAVATAIAACPVPVWTAVGHATDSTVADLVANRSWATPSAAAAALIERVTTTERLSHERRVLVAHRAAMEGATRRSRHAWAVAGVAVLVAFVVVGLALGWF
jgi:exodeoxyribonuclease VII large subunit